ncbi:MAG TPA: aa3-type cytochrome c oxidase subunit IV [Beijerinckiaceae bacterium]|nr:aa3-type cytochrome c oxidase subunit IV [Beijerinckiaceae bacterium]
MAEIQVMAGGHPDMDYAEHERTYRRFLTVAKWAVIHIVVLLILMAYFLT